jgi:hypothetical protein
MRESAVTHLAGPKLLTGGPVVGSADGEIKSIGQRFTDAVGRVDGHCRCEVLTPAVSSD